MFSLYLLVWLVIAAIFAYFTWPKAEALYARLTASENSQESGDNKNVGTNERPPGITMGGTYIYATPDRIIIWTTIKLVDALGKETYLSSLGKDNFSVLESYSGNKYKAPVLEVKSSNVPIRAILVVDKSGSMSEPSGINNYTKMDIVKDAAVFFMEQLTRTASNHVAILPFSGDEVGHKNFLKSQDGDIWSSQAERNYLELSIKSLRAGGNTPLWQAIDVALDEFSSTNDESYKAIICLSDGMDNRASKIFDSLLEKVKKKQIPIFTIGYGIEGKLNARELILISNESGAGKELVGSFIRVPPKNWASQLQNIGTDFANLYELYWEPTGATPGTQVNVEIQVTYDLNGQHFNTKEWRSYVFPERKQ